MAATGATGTAVLTIYGLYQLAAYIYSLAGVAVTAGVLVVMATILLTPFGYHYARPQVLRDFHLARFATDRICTKRKRIVNVAADRRATIKEQQRFIFLKTPEPGELVDIYSVHREANLEGFEYVSSDAVSVKQHRVDKYRLAVQWKPKKVIEPFVEYDHSDDHIATMLYDQPVFYVEHHCIFPTGTFMTVVNYPDPIVRGVAFRRPRWRRLATTTCFVEHALKQENIIQYGSFQYMNDRHTVTWTMTTPETGVSYVAVFFSEGAVELWQNTLRAEHSVRCSLRRIKDCVPLMS
jgi:hypothetical protein